jgi:hypothetical protein
MQPKKHISITFPAGMAREAARLAKRENRTMSELLREAFRHYRARDHRRSSDDFASIRRIVADAKSNPLSPKELAAEDRRLLQIGAARAKKIGSKEQDAVRLIHESRARRSAS